MTDSATGPRPSPGKEYRLLPHPDFPSGGITAITIAIDQKGSALVLRYTVEGALDQVRWPAPETSSRTDELWKHTCFEAFVGHPQAGYTEYNFSPSGAWASYFFDRYRDGMRPATWFEDPVVTSSFNGAFSLRAEIDLAMHLKEGASHLALSAVIEETDGTKSYWALAHAAGPPDFHNRDCFIATLPAPTGA